MRKRCPDFASLLRGAEPTQALRDQIVGCFHEELRRLALRRCKDKTLAEEAAQDAVVASLEKLGTYRGDAPLDHWLSRIVVSACSRLRRGRKNSPAYNVPLDEHGESHPRAEATQEARLFVSERLTIVRKALEELAPDNREMLLLHEGQGETLEALAARYELTVDGVKARLKRARARVRKRASELADGT